MILKIFLWLFIIGSIISIYNITRWFIDNHHNQKVINLVEKITVKEAAKIMGKHEMFIIIL